MFLFPPNAPFNIKIFYGDLMEISSEILVAVLSFAGTLVGSFGGMQLIKYRIQELEKRVDKHNNVIERMYKLEENEAVQDEKIRVINHRISDLEKEEKDHEN